MSGGLGIINFREIHFNSKYRTSGTNEQPTFNIYQTQNIRQIQVLELEVPFTWYCVDTTNNSIDIFEPASGPVTTVAIPAGNYTIADFTFELATRLTAASPNGYTYSTSINPNNYTVTITSTGIFNILWATGPNSATNMHELIGFTTTNNSGNTSYTGTNSYNMNQDAVIFVKCDQIRGFDSEVTHVNPSIDSKILSRIPVNVNSGEVISYISFTSNPTNVQFNSLNQIQVLSFSLTRENNQPIDLHGLPWSMKLGVFTK